MELADFITKFVDDLLIVFFSDFVLQLYLLLQPIDLFPVGSIVSLLTLFSHLLLLSKV